MHSLENQSDPTQPYAARATALTLPPPEIAYLEAVVDRLRTSLGPHLLGVYLFGSTGSGDYLPGISDLDVHAVLSDSIDRLQCAEIAKYLSHRILPCPATRLDFVCYTRAAVDPAQRTPHFELNLNTSEVFEQVMFEPSVEASHWFLLDIAIGRELGYALYGPSPTDIFAPIPRVWQLVAIRESLEWYRAHDLASPNSVLNACRGWRYAVTGVLGSKAAGAAWVRAQPDCLPVVTRAEIARRDGTQLEADEASALIAMALKEVQYALDHGAELFPPDTAASV